MEEQNVSHNVASLINDKGFKEVRCLSVFVNEELEDFPEGELYSNSDLQSEWFKNNHNYDVVVPTQSLAQKWIREVHKLEVLVYCNASGWMWEINKAYEIGSLSGGTFVSFSDFSGTNDSGEWDTYEDALDEGLHAALNLIK